MNDYLAEQAVLVFANATERTNQLPAPQEGMLCYLSTTDTVYFYNGTTWIGLLGDSVSALTARTLLVCTSVTRPAHAAGRPIYETDTGHTYVSDGTNWVRLGGGTVGYAQVTADQAVATTSATDLTGLSVTFTAIASRRYRITGYGLILKTTASGTVNMQIRQGTTVHNDFNLTLTGAEYGQFTPTAVLTGLTGSVTMKLTIVAATSGAQLIAAAARPAYILVEDIT